MSLRNRTAPAVLAASVALALTGCAAAAAPASTTTTASSSITGSAARALDRLETEHASRLGVAAIDTRSGRTVLHRAGERFAFASTNKVFIAAAVLKRASAEDLGTVIHYSSADLLAYAPITSRLVDSGMTIAELLDAMLRFSDNTAANVLVRWLGGTPTVQEYLRGIGDRTTRVDRIEPDLNEATPGDPRDTTTPAAFARSLRTAVLDGGLETADRVLLRNEMLANTTGDATIRAGVDPASPVADKTGTGDRGIRNDIAVVYPVGRSPLIVVVMTEPKDPSASPDDALVAKAAKIAVDALLR